MYSIIKENGQLTDEDYEKAALILNVRKLRKQLKNYSNILKKSEISIKKIENVKTSTPDEDWLEYFEELSSKVSNESMQEIWAQLLTKERIASGSISKVMLNTFSMLDKESATAFGKLCRLTYKLRIDDGRVRYIPLVLYDDILHGIINKKKQDKDVCNIISFLEEYQSFLPTIEEMEYLSEINLIDLTPVHDESEIYSHSSMEITFSVNDSSFKKDSLYDEVGNYHFICTGQAFFTQTGLALYNALSFNSYEHLFQVLEEYIVYTIDNLSNAK